MVIMLIALSIGCSGVPEEARERRATWYGEDGEVVPVGDAFVASTPGTLVISGDVYLDSLEVRSEGVRVISEVHPGLRGPQLDVWQPVVVDEEASLDVEGVRLYGGVVCRRRATVMATGNAYLVSNEGDAPVLQLHDGCTIMLDDSNVIGHEMVNLEPGSTLYLSGSKAEGWGTPSTISGDIVLVNGSEWDGDGIVSDEGSITAISSVITSSELEVEGEVALSESRMIRSNLHVYGILNLYASSAISDLTLGDMGEARWFDTHTLLDVGGDLIRYESGWCSQDGCWEL
jgi:hypothetical protein